MRSRSISTLAVVVAAATAVIPSAGAAAKAERVTHLSCALELSAQGPPQGMPPSANSFGLVSCPRPLGRGLHYSSATASPTGPGQGTVAVTFKKYFDRGTISGTVAGTFSAASPKNISYAGAVRITRGTGAFRRVKGKGRIACTSSDGGQHKSCTFKLAITGV